MNLDFLYGFLVASIGVPALLLGWYLCMRRVLRRQDPKPTPKTPEPLPDFTVVRDGLPEKSGYRDQAALDAERRATLDEAVSKLEAAGFDVRFDGDPRVAEPVMDRHGVLTMLKASLDATLGKHAPYCECDECSDDRMTDLGHSYPDPPAAVGHLRKDGIVES